MTMKGKAAAWVQAATGVLGMAAGAAAQIPWSNSSGAGTFFTWSNGQNLTGLFGDPILVGGNQFVFFPNNFNATSAGGGMTTVFDRFDVDLLANQDYKFTGIRIEVLGDYSILTQGSVDCQAMLDIAEIGGPMRTTSDPLATSPAMPVFSGVNQVWHGVADRDLLAIELLTGVPFTHIHVSFSNTLIAISAGPGHSAVINKAVVGFPISMTIIPTPGVAGVLILAGGWAARRRR